MANVVMPVLLNIGLDTVTPPLMAKEGSLIECMNYELTDATGYRRIDGYESYDGFPNGDITEYYRLEITANNPAQQAELIPGTVIYRADFAMQPVAIGVVLGGPFPDNLYDISPLRTSDSFVLTEEFLVQTDGESFIRLASGLGLLRILGDSPTVGTTFVAYAPDGTTIPISISDNLQAGGSLVPGQEYLDNLRIYSQALRDSVVPAPGPIAGLYWFNDRLLAAVNALRVSLVIASTDPQPEPARRYRWDGTVYEGIHLSLDESGSDNVYSLYLQAVGDADTTSDDLVEIAYDGTAIKTWQTNTSSTGNPSYENSKVAYLGYFPNYNISTERGFQPLPAATNIQYSDGESTSALGPAVTFDSSGEYYLVGTDGAVLRVRLNNVIQTGGTFTDGTSTGRAQFVTVAVEDGDRNYAKDGDELHTEYPTTASSRVLVVSGTPARSYLAGTGALDERHTRYQWISANFYGRIEGNAAYGTTGASQAFWANSYGYGTLPTGVDESLDMPKYVAFHAGKLALGYARGSVILSVLGEPANYNGEDGAMEIATGDTLTGLLEMPGETLAVFGLRSIRKISGTTDADTVLGTISGSSGCFDYTAVLVGQDAIFTGINGISTLQQTAAYGDFAGQRMSDSIANWLRPKLATGFESLQRGGTVMAYPVRGKNQYRLVLSSGETVVLTVTSEGPKITLINYGLVGETRVPYAWSSNIDHNGKERTHVAWTHREKSRQVFELESGWGFNGRSFRHYFDTTYLFNNNGSMFSGIEKVRLFGQGYGVATLNVLSSGIEDDFEQPYHETIQDISIPRFIENIYNRMQPVTNIVDQANWGLGIKLRFEGTTNEGNTLTEPPHICQALVLHVRTEGALDA